jgi:hypothetical protein
MDENDINKYDDETKAQAGKSSSLLFIAVWVFVWFFEHSLPLITIWTPVFFLSGIIIASFIFAPIRYVCAVRVARTMITQNKYGEIYLRTGGMVISFVIRISFTITEIAIVYFSLNYLIQVLALQ